MHDYGETKESAYSQYLDFNYQWALSQSLPDGGFVMLKVYQCVCMILS